MASTACAPASPPGDGTGWGKVTEMLRGRRHLDQDLWVCELLEAVFCTAFIMHLLKQVSSHEFIILESRLNAKKGQMLQPVFD